MILQIIYTTKIYNTLINFKYHADYALIIIYKAFRILSHFVLTAILWIRILIFINNKYKQLLSLTFWPRYTVIFPKSLIGVKSKGKWN